jgi:hypothetical protein
MGREYIIHGKDEETRTKFQSGTKIRRQIQGKVNKYIKYI